MSETRTCRITGEEFEVTADDKAFYEKMGVPIPDISPNIRFKWRAMWRNETTLYSGQKCDMCSKPVVTMYNQKKPYTIYCYNCFYSEGWDPRDYAMSYDTKRPFLEQYKELIEKVPKIATYLSLGSGENINSEYVNMASGCKDCYLIFNSGPAEEVMYARGVKDLRDSVDLYFGTKLERCYECVNTQQCTGVVFGQNVVSCVDSYFLMNCSGCSNCFGCINLRNKSYHFFNEELPKKEYEEKVAGIIGSHEKMKQMRNKFETFSLDFPRRENNNLKTYDSTGDYLFECKNVKNSFECSNGEDCSYIYSSKNIKDSLGTTGYGHQAEQILECIATGFTSWAIGSYGIEHSQNVCYSFYINNCHDCFGCDALKNGSYAILNKQYSKEEYDQLKEHIVEELKEQGLYGLCPPPEYAPFSYNESVAHDNFPMSKEDAISQGFRWEDNIQETRGKETLQPDDIPDHINDVDDTIVNEILTCVDTGRNYKITAQELQFYRKMKLPIPRKSFFARHADRIERRGPYKFWNRNCGKCSKAIVTNYSPERPEVVYCEECWRNEVL